MRIGCVSDVCLGYGSPQIGFLMESLIDHYGAEALVVEPRIPARAPRHNFFPRLKVRRAQTEFDPYSSEGRIEYVLDAARMMNEWQPDILVICCTFTLPVLFKLRKRPSYVVYYSYESITHYGEFDVEMNRQLRGAVDAVIFPEENRAALELSRIRFDAPVLILYNCPRLDSQRPLPREMRNGRFLHAGTIDPVETLAEYYTDARVAAYPIDLYGPIRRRSEQEREAFRNRIQERVQYCGYTENRELSELRRHYIYSLVIWNPGTENQLYAAPNKFFESIAAGVPPLTAPHPQCKKIVDRYGCGLLLSDWSLDGLVTGLERASKLYGSDQWDEMVARCEEAFTNELNWERQFEKLRVHLVK